MASSTTYMSLNTYMGADSGKRFYGIYEGLSLLGDQDYAVGAAATILAPLPYSGTPSNIPVIIGHKGGGPVILSYRYQGQAGVSAATTLLEANEFAVIANAMASGGVSANAYGASALIRIGMFSK